MDPFGSRHKQTKKSCLMNAVVALLLGVFMVGCIFAGGDTYKEGLMFGAALMVAVAGYWVYRWHKFDDKDFNDPFGFNKDRK